MAIDAIRIAVFFLNSGSGSIFFKFKTTVTCPCLICLKMATDEDAHVVVELIKNEKAQSAILNHLKLKMDNKKLLLQFAIIVMRL